VGALLTLTPVPRGAVAAELQAGQAAPLFTAKTHDGTDFDLAVRKGQWTVLYFFPRLFTESCG